MRQKPGDKELPLGKGKACESVLNQGTLLVVVNIVLAHFAMVKAHLLTLTSEKIKVGNRPPHEAGRLGIENWSEEELGKH